MKTIHNARLYLWNTPELSSRAIDYREYSIEEIQNDAAVYAYLAAYKNALGDLGVRVARLPVPEPKSS